MNHPETVPGSGAQAPQVLPPDLLAESTSHASEALHTLQALGEVFCATRSWLFRDFGRSLFLPRLNHVHVTSWAHSREAWKDPALFCLFGWGDEEEGRGLVWVSRPLMCLLLDSFLGGHTTPEAMKRHMQRPVTGLEKRRAENLCHTLLRVVRETLAESGHVRNIQPLDSAVLVRDVDLADDDERVVVLELGIHVDGHEGDMHIVLPCRLLDSMAADLQKSRVISFLETRGSSAAWPERMSPAVCASQTVLQALLYDKTQPLGQVLAWHEGHVLPLPVSTMDPVASLSCYGKPAGQGQVFAEEGQLKVRLTGVPHAGSSAV